MAELVLKVGTVGPDPSWQDGDVIDCFNDRRIKQIHAEVVCSYASPPRNNEGNGLEGTLCDFMHTKVCTFRYDPLADGTAIRIRLADNAVDRIPIRDAHTNKHTIAFGFAPNIYWYGGQQLFTAAALDLVWTEIEARTPFRLADHTLAPLGTQDLKSHLAIKVDDFSEAERVTLTSPRYDAEAEPNMLKKREHTVQWRAMALGVPVRDVENPAVSIDVRRNVSFSRAVVVRRKL